MSDLTKIEKLQFERLFGMSSGYVLNFNNRTFGEFVLESTKLDIFDDKYNYWSGSKANRLRSFWDKESNYIVAKLLTDLLDYWKTFYTNVTTKEREQYDECLKIVERLKQQSPVENIDALSSEAADDDFDLLVDSIRDSVFKNRPEAALDRLHTFVVKFIRQLCNKHGITVDNNKPLHSLFGEYVRVLKDKGVLDSEMSERILKTTISVMESFNDVRNKQSFAHDNPILNPRESILIFNNVANAIRFINSIEDEFFRKKEELKSAKELDDLPF